MKQTPSHRYPPPIHPSSLKNQESLYLDRKSATNLATICWDIFSFHVFQLGLFLILWKSPLLRTCASPLFRILIVNRSIVWLLTVLHLARPSAVWVNVWGGLWFKGGCTELAQTTLACIFTFHFCYTLSITGGCIADWFHIVVPVFWHQPYVAL